MLSADIFNNTLCSSMHYYFTSSSFNLFITPPSSMSLYPLASSKTRALLLMQYFPSCHLMPAGEFYSPPPFSHNKLNEPVHTGLVKWPHLNETRANTGRHRHNLFYSKTFDHAQVFWLAATCKSMGWFINTYIKVMFCNLSEKITITNTEICYKTD